MLRNLFFSLFFLLINNLVFSQDLLPNAKFWSGISVNKKLSKKIKLDVGTLQSFNTNDLSFSFNQSNLGLEYSFSRKFKGKINYALGQFNWSRNYNKYDIAPNVFQKVSIHRLGIAAIYKLKLGKGFKLKQTIDVQHFFPTLDKYKIRSLYRVKLYYKNGIFPLKSTLFCEGILYHYLGGNPIVYRDENNAVSSYESPNGFHRYRLKAGINMKPLKNHGNLLMILYFSTQKEFNLASIGNDIHVIRPDQGNPQGKSNIIYPFNNYNVIGIHFIYSIKKKQVKNKLIDNNRKVKLDK